MQIFQTKWFARWAAKEGLPDEALRQAVAEINDGLIDADLGGNVIKKRVAIAGRGKSGRLRTILAFRLKNKAFFLYGYAKNQRDNIDKKITACTKIISIKIAGIRCKNVTASYTSRGIDRGEK